MSGDKKRKLPEGWRWEKLENIFELKYGSGLPKDLRKKGLFPVFGSNGIVGYNSESITNGSTIIIGRKGSAGEVVWSDVACWPIDTTYYIEELKKKGNLKYIYHALRFLKLSGLDKSSAVPGLNRDDVYSIEICLPPTPSDQDIIASDLERRMAHVERMRVAALRQKDAIAAMQGAILREAFPYEAGDELPEGWKWEELGNLFTIEKQQINPFDESFYSLRFIGMENIESNTRKFIPNGNKEESGDSTCLLFDNKHVLYGKLRPYLNKVYLPDKKGRCSTELIPLIPKNGFSRSFIASVLQSEIVVTYAVKHSTGGRMPRADMEKLIKLKVPLPSNSNTSAAELDRKMAELEKARQAAERQLEAIKMLPGAILREVFDFEEENTGS
ncbi:MAG: restriction endonuclease subunit S [Candidatus Methanoperedens sp.]|nr:restriction endonuclease subunit S [Candidatus Methanoperedens sp.]